MVFERTRVLFSPLAEYELLHGRDRCLPRSLLDASLNYYYYFLVMVMALVYGEAEMGVDATMIDLLFFAFFSVEVIKKTKSK